MKCLNIRNLLEGILDRTKIFSASRRTDIYLAQLVRLGEQIPCMCVFVCVHVCAFVCLCVGVCVVKTLIRNNTFLLVVEHRSSEPVENKQ